MTDMPTADQNHKDDDSSLGKTLAGIAISFAILGGLGEYYLQNSESVTKTINSIVERLQAKSPQSKLDTDFVQHTDVQPPYYNNDIKP